MSPLVIRLGIGIVLSGLIGALAYWRNSLTASGAVGAVIVGTAIFGFGGLIWGLLLIVFFISSSALSRFREAEKEVVAQTFAKGGKRDLWQALANAGAGSLFSVATLLTDLAGDQVLFAAFLGAMATVNADTWATEIGVLARKQPRMITTGESVDAGTSGGVTSLGTLATLAGALLIGIVAALLSLAHQNLNGDPYVVPFSEFWGTMLLVAAAGGLTGSLLDSFLGATVQAMYYSSSRDKETEKRIDPNGDANEHIRGWAWLDNDVVNFISSLAGAGVAALWWVLI